MDTLKRFGLSSLALAVSTACAVPAFADDSAQHANLRFPSGWMQFKGASQTVGMAAYPGALVSDLSHVNLDRRVELTEQVMPNGSSVMLAYQRWSPVLPSSTLSLYGPQLAGFSVISKNADGNEYSIGTGGLAFRYFGAGGLDIGDAGVSSVPALANPYFSLVPSATHAGITREVGGIKIKFGILTSGLSHNLTMHAFDPSTLSPALVMTVPRANSRLLEFSKSFENGAVSFSLMRSREVDRYVLMSNGALPLFGAGAATNSMQLTGVWLLAPKFALAAQASYGRTPSESGDGVVRSNAFSLALVAADRFYPGDRLSIALSQPIRAYDGYTTVDTLTGITSNGATLVDRRVVSAEPSGRELLAELYYMRPLSKTATLGWTLGVRRQPNNNADAAPEKLFMVRLTKQF
ncbi:MAG: hypothetical protein HYS18_15885 [Burkholderiales bacterium]|nr:hypothetical protein [Burkholderiales bacterium]